MVADEEQLSFRVIDNIMNLFGVELMEYGYSNSSVCECGNKSYCPLAGVAPAECNLVTLYDSGVLKQDVEFFYLTRHIVVLQGLSLEIGQCVEIPIVDDGFLKQRIKTWYILHIIDIGNVLYSF